MSENDNSFLEVNGWKVYFEKFGSGPNPVLFIPGPIGTGRSDFEELLDGDDELDWDKFTVIAVEAPGWGRSRPPLRNYGSDVYNIDAECFHSVMQHLGYSKYSVVGWSEGAKVALLMATKYCKSIEGLVLSSISTKTSNKALNNIMSTKSVDTWSKRKIDPYLKVYKTKEEIQKLWTRYIKFREFYHQYFPEDIYKNKYELIKCPVLIFYGEQDALIESEQPFAIYQKLRNSKLHRFPKGEHDCHLKYSPQFSTMMQAHLLNKNIVYQKVEDEISNPEMDQFLTNRIQA